MTANRIVGFLFVAWLILIALSALHPALLSAGNARDRSLDQLVAVAAWQSIAMVVAIIVVILRLVLNHRLSRTARWIAWVPPVWSLIAIIGFSIFGHIVG